MSALKILVIDNSFVLGGVIKSGVCFLKTIFGVLLG